MTGAELKASHDQAVAMLATKHGPPAFKNSSMNKDSNEKQQPGLGKALAETSWSLPSTREVQSSGKWYSSCDAFNQIGDPHKNERSSDEMPAQDGQWIIGDPNATNNHSHDQQSKMISRRQDQPEHRDDYKDQQFPQGRGGGWPNGTKFRGSHDAGLNSLSIHLTMSSSRSNRKGLAQRPSKPQTEGLKFELNPVWEVGDPKATGTQDIPAKSVPDKHPRAHRQQEIRESDMALRNSKKILSLDAVIKSYSTGWEAANVPRDILINRFLEDIKAFEASKQASNHKSAFPDDKDTAHIQRARNSEHIVRDPDNYEVPSFEPKQMKAQLIDTLPQYQTLVRQVERTLPPEIQAIPSPTYLYSKKRGKKQTDPTLTGALRWPPPRAMTPAENPLDISPAHFPDLVAAVSLFKEAPAASIGSLDGVSEYDFRIVAENDEDIARWHWFSKQTMSAPSDVATRELNFELSRERMDADVANNQTGSQAGDLWQEEGFRRSRICKWVAGETANMLKWPILVDTSTQIFRSGRWPASGVRYNYQEFPPDLAYPPVRLKYTPIEWSTIFSPKLNDPAYRDTRCFNQTPNSHIYREQIRIARAEERRLESRLEQESTQYSTKETPHPKRTDFSQRIIRDNPLIGGMNVRIRFAHSSDVEAITEIYNHYTQQTRDAPEVVNVSPAAMMERLRATRREGYPFLVAVIPVDDSKDTPKRGFAKLRRIDRRPKELVVGFARARSWSGLHVNCFDDVALVEVFVKPQYTRAKVGANLLDRILTCLDSDYTSMAGAAVVTELGQLRKNHFWRRTHALVTKLFYTSFDEPSFIGRMNFLERQFGFTQIGNFIEFCTKDEGKTRYHMCYMQRKVNRTTCPPIDSMY